MTPEIRIRKIFRPVSYIISAILDSLHVVPNAVAVFSFIMAITSFSIFLVAYNISSSLAEVLVKFAILCIFLNALADDVTRDIEHLSGKTSEFGGILGSFLDRYSDIFIVIGIGVFLKDVPWYDIGVYINVGADGHMFLVFLIIIGSLIVSYISADDPSHHLGLEARSERMYLLTIFAAAGIFLQAFQGMLFFGLVALCIALYATMLHTVLMPEHKRETHEIKHEHYTGERGNTIRNTIQKIIHTFEGILGIFWKSIGIAILGIYHIWNFTKTHTKNLKIPRPDIKINMDRIPKPRLKTRRFERNSFTILVMEEKTEKPIPDAKITLVSEETSAIKTGYTDSNGIAMFRDISQGTYELEAECQGYEKESRSKYIEQSSGGEAFALKPAAEVFQDVMEKEESKTKETPERQENRRPKSTAQELVEKKIIEKRKKQKRQREDDEETTLMGESMLVEYKPSEKPQTGVEKIIDFYLQEKRQILLASPPEDIEQYIEKYKEEIENGEVEIINLLTEGGATPRYEGIREMPITSIGRIGEEFENLETGNVVVFAPLSEMIRKIGTAEAFRFISQTIDDLSGIGISFIAFLKKEGEKKDAITFENLFMNLATIEDGKLKKIGEL